MDHHCTVSADKGYTNFTWTLEDWTLLRDHYETIISPEFVLHDTDGKTCILIFKASPDCQASVNIQFPRGIQYHTMKTSLSFLKTSRIKLNTIEKTFRDSDTCCILALSYALSTTNTRQYLTNDNLTLFFELTIVKSVENSALRTKISNADFSTDICKNFKVILDSKDLYDVTFVVRGKKLYAHKVILAANSEVFRAMFTTEMKEQTDSIVEIVDTDATMFEVFLTYMYTGGVSEIENVVDELIVVADKYQVMGLKQLCERYMSNHINDDTVITYLLKAYQVSCTEVHENCIDFVRINMHVLENLSNLANISKYPSIVSQVFKKKRTDEVPRFLHNRNTDFLTKLLNQNDNFDFTRRTNIASENFSR